MSHGDRVSSGKVLPWGPWNGAEGRAAAYDLQRRVKRRGIASNGVGSGNFFHGGHGMGRNGGQRTACGGERGDEASDAWARGQFRDTSSMGAMECAEAHIGCSVLKDLTACEGGRAAGDVHATSLRAHGTLPGNFFHGGNGRVGIVRTPGLPSGHTELPLLS